MILQGCAICGNADAIGKQTAGDAGELECSRCGKYRITGTAVAMWSYADRTDEERAYAAGWLHDHPGVEITSSHVPLLRALRPPTVASRADRLLLCLSDRYPAVGAPLPLSFVVNAEALTWMGPSWSVSCAEVGYLLLQYLTEEKKWLSIFDGASIEKCKTRHSANLIISPAGHARIDELRRAPIVSSIGFCAMWFDLQSAWRDAISPAIARAGFQPLRIDNDHAHTNTIDDEIIAGIRRSKFLVADLTGHRGGVYFEAGFALGLGRSVIWTVREDDLERLHFDTRQYPFITWHENDLPEFGRKLTAKIEALFGKGPVVS